VLYVTERCVFELTPRGLALAEVAPGIDLERDILAHMHFKPLVDTPRTMDARIFRTEPMDLRAMLLDPDLPRRIHYDAAQDTLFLNFRHLQIGRQEDIEAIRATVSAQCQAIGHRVPAVVSYDGFQIAPGLEEAYAAMAHAMHEQWYSRVTRLASGAFKRMKVAQALTDDGGT
jgi:propionate CoA-transferase